MASNEIEENFINDDVLICSEENNDFSMENAELENALKEKCHITDESNYMDTDNNLNNIILLEISKNVEKLTTYISNSVEKLVAYAQKYQDDFNTLKAEIKSSTTNDKRKVPKLEKISFDNNDKRQPFAMPHSFKSSVIKCFNGENFGQIVGRNGCNIRSIYKELGVHVVVPDVENCKTLPLIILLATPQFASNLKYAEEKVLNHLLYKPFYQDIN